MIFICLFSFQILMSADRIPTTVTHTHLVVTMLDHSVAPAIQGTMEMEDLVQVIVLFILYQLKFEDNSVM